MKVLVIGGTQFVGRHTVERLLHLGHEVVLVNRGKSGPDLFPSVRKILCDRSHEDFITLLKKERSFDALIDFCAYYPREVEKLLPILPGLTGHYVQISSVSAYRATEMDSISFIRDDDALSGCTRDEEIDRTNPTYGKRKAKCEQLAMAQSAIGVPVTIFRPSLIYGKYDQTDRFAYWVWRVAQNKPFLIPDDGLCTTQRTYAPDFAEVIISALHSKSALHQAYNFAEVEPMSLRATLQIIGEHLRIDPLKWAVSASSEQLMNMKVKTWSDLPMWLPRTNLLMDTFKIRKDLTPVETNARAAIGAACDAFLSLGKPPKAGLTPEVEHELLEKIQGSR